MRVLQINSVCGNGSTGRIAKDIYSVLEDNGYKCIIAYGRGYACNDINTIKIGSSLNNVMHLAQTRLFDSHGLSSSYVTSKFIKQVIDFNPDIIHLHNIHGYYINIEKLFAFLLEYKGTIIWTLHDCWAFTGHCSHFEYINCDKWKYSCYKCPQKDQYPESFIVDNSKRNYEIKKILFTSIKDMIIITPSKWLCNLAKQSFLGKYTFNIINNGIDLNVFKNTPSEFRCRYKLQDKFIILGVASVFGERKGYKFFLELSKYINEDEFIALVGVNDKQKKELPKNIIGITRTNSMELLAGIYSEVDVYINLTLEDTFPTTNIEALACGVPVITFDSGGSKETIDSNTGIVVERGSISILLNSIKEIKKRGKNYYSKSCIQRTRHLFDKKDRYSDYLNLYKRYI